MPLARSDTGSRSAQFPPFVENLVELDGMVSRVWFKSLLSWPLSRRQLYLQREEPLQTLALVRFSMIAKVSAFYMLTNFSCDPDQLVRRSIVIPFLKGVMSLPPQVS